MIVWYRETTCSGSPSLFQIWSLLALKKRKKERWQKLKYKLKASKRVRTNQWWCHGCYVHYYIQIMVCIWGPESEVVLSIQLVAICNLSARFHQIVHTGTLTFYVIKKDLWLPNPRWICPLQTNEQINKNEPNQNTPKPQQTWKPLNLYSDQKWTVKSIFCSCLSIVFTYLPK